jgi:hypothetical protein
MVAIRSPCNGMGSGSSEKIGIVLEANICTWQKVVEV